MAAMMVRLSFGVLRVKVAVCCVRAEDWSWSQISWMHAPIVPNCGDGVQKHGSMVMGLHTLVGRFRERALPKAWQPMMVSINTGWTI